MGAIVGIFISVAIVIGAAYGYIANIVSLVTQNESIGLVVARAIGMFVAPLGIVLGYF